MHCRFALTSTSGSIAKTLMLMMTLLSACGGGDESDDLRVGEDGGGISGSAGSGGLVGTGGVGAGGTAGSGGVTGSGGVIGTGGALATGGAAGTGGFMATGGVAGAGGLTGTGGAGGPVTAAECYAFLPGGDVVPDYDQFGPVIGSHCNGTNHQDVQNVERLVILGDSISEGTPPTGAADFYRNVLGGLVQQRFGTGVVVEECAENGARNDDLMTQIGLCFPQGGDTRVTLTVFTMGGNDAAAWARDGLTTDQAIAQADAAADLLDAAVAWLKDPMRFPNGSYVVFANVYEYTDGTADLSSCPLAAVAGLSGTWTAGIPALVHFEERYAQVALNRGADMIFLLENFCGHGYRRDDPSGPCYRGPSQELWFDLTCIHPTPTGHHVIADLFMDVIGE